MPEMFSPIEDALWNLQGPLMYMHHENYALYDVIEKNLKRIADSTQQVNCRFGLKIGSAIVQTGLEQEFLNKYDEGMLKDFLEPIYTGYNFKLQDNPLKKQRTFKHVYGANRVQDTFKHELSTVAPTSIAEQIVNYTNMMLDMQMGDEFMPRYSAHINVSIADKDNPNPNYTQNPMNNKEFRDMLGKNIARFVDEALPLLDTRKSIEKGGEKGLSNDAHMQTDRIGYYDGTGSGQHTRAHYQVAFRPDAPVVDTDEAETEKSHARLEMRRLSPGENLNNYMIADPVLLGYAVITSAIAYTFEHMQTLDLKEYNYRGSSYDYHMGKLKNSELLKEYLGKDLVDKMVGTLKESDRKLRKINK